MKSNKWKSELDDMIKKVEDYKAIIEAKAKDRLGEKVKDMFTDYNNRVKF